MRYSLNPPNSSSRFSPLASTSQGARVSALARKDIEQLFAVYTSAENRLLIIGIGRSSHKVPVDTILERRRKVGRCRGELPDPLRTRSRQCQVPVLVLRQMPSTSPCPHRSRGLDGKIYRSEIAFLNAIVGLKQDDALIVLLRGGEGYSVVLESCIQLSKTFASSS